jgi:hypothetical protein
MATIRLMLGQAGFPMVPLCGNDMVQPLGPVVTRDRRHLLVREMNPGLQAYQPNFVERWLGWLTGRVPMNTLQDVVTVLEANTGRELVRMEHEQTEYAIISDDGSTLVTAHRDLDGAMTLRVWDVPLRRSWKWIIGIPATLLTLVLAARWWRTRRKGPSAARAEPDTLATASDASGS